MGNTPTTQPFEGDAPDADESDGGGSVREAVVGFVRATLDSARRRLSVFPSLNFGSAFVVDDAPVGESRPLRPARREGPADTGGHSGAAFPERSIPLVEPARDTSKENAPDLEAAEDDGHLSIYYPDRTDARITSDTWEEVEP